MSNIRYANSPEELMKPAEALKLSGLESMQRMLAGEFPAPPISRTLNFRMHDVDKGRAVFRGVPTFDSFNPMGTLHGGWYGAILDSAMACAVMSALRAGQYYTTLEYKVNILKSVPEGMAVLCEGKTQHVGRSTGIAVGELRGEDDGKLYATGSTTCIVMGG